MLAEGRLSDDVTKAFIFLSRSMMIFVCVADSVIFLFHHFLYNEAAETYLKHHVIYNDPLEDCWCPFILSPVSYWSDFHTYLASFANNDTKQWFVPSSMSLNDSQRYSPHFTYWRSNSQLRIKESVLQKPGQNSQACGRKPIACNSTRKKEPRGAGGSSRPLQRTASAICSYQPLQQFVHINKSQWSVRRRFILSVLANPVPPGPVPILLQEHVLATLFWSGASNERPDGWGMSIPPLC